MATISFAGASSSSIGVNIAHNGSSVNRYKLFYGTGGSAGTLWEDISFTTATSHSAQRFITGLSSSTNYTVTVVYLLGATQVGAQATNTWSTTAQPPPPVPGATTISSIVFGNPNAYVPTTVTASWSSASNATSYDYQIVGLGISGNTASTSFSFTGSAAGTYNFTVYPRNSSGLGTGDSRSFTLVIPPDTVPPTTNGIFSYTVTDTSITISASLASDAGSGVAGYKVFYKLGTGTTGLIRDGTIYGTYGDYTIYNLAEGTLYTVAIQAFDYAANSRSDYTSSTITTTSSIPASPPSIQSRYEGGFIVTWGAVAGANLYEIAWKSPSSSTWSGFDALVETGTTSNLGFNTYGVTYDLRVRASKNSGSTYGAYSPVSQGTTAPITPNITLGTYNNDIATFQMPNMFGGWSVIIVDKYLRSNDSLVESRTIANPTTTLSWAESNVYLYYFRARSRIDLPGGSIYSVGSSAPYAFNRPANFAWTFPKVQGEELKVTALEWNSFINRINSFRAYKTQATYAFSTAIVGNKIKADHINQARNAILSMNPSVSIPAFCTADLTPVSAYYFNRLRDSLNSVT